MVERNLDTVEVVGSIPTRVTFHYIRVELFIIASLRYCLTVRIGAFPALGPGSTPGIGISIFYYDFISHSITTKSNKIETTANHR